MLKLCKGEGGRGRGKYKSVIKFTVYITITSYSRQPRDQMSDLKL